MEQLYVIKKSVEDFRSENVTPNNLKLIETLKGEIPYLRNKNIAKTSFIKYLTQSQGKVHVKATITPNIHQQKSINNTLPSRQN